MLRILTCGLCGTYTDQPREVNLLEDADEGRVESAINLEPINSDAAATPVATESIAPRHIENPGILVSLFRS